MNTFSKKVVFAALAACSLAIGCSAAPAPEREGSAQSKLLAPKPLVTAKASAATTKALGIVEWRVHRGRGDVFVTGYDAGKRAVKGFAVGFDRKTGASAALLHARALDGSRYSTRHAYGGSRAVSKSMPAPTRELLAFALADLRGGVRHLIPPGTQAPGAPQAPAPGAPVPPPATPAGEGCGADLMVLVTAAIQCVQQANGDLQAAMQCVLAAQAGAAAGQACGDPNAQPMDPGAMCGDPYGQGDPNGQGDPYGQGDPNGQGDPYGQGDPNGQAGGMCQDPGGLADQAGQDPGACPSCPPDGGYGDIQGDPNNGGVTGCDAGGGDPNAGGDPYGGGADEGY